MTHERRLHRTNATFRHACGIAAACLLSVQVDTLLGTSPQRGHLQVVGRQELVKTMGRHGAYDPTATTNGARFQAEVLLHLARTAKDRDPEGSPLFVGHEDWFHAFLEVTGRTAETAPLYAVLAHRHRQDIEIEYRSDRIIRSVKNGPHPEIAIGVVIWWSRTTGGAGRYSYQDTLSTPHLRVTNGRVITYRLLDFGNIVVYDQIEGLSGQPTSGLLGLLFSAIGEGRVTQSRMAISRDGLQVSRAKVKKAFLGLRQPLPSILTDTPKRMCRWVGQICLPWRYGSSSH